MRLPCFVKCLKVQSILTFRPFNFIFVLLQSLQVIAEAKKIRFANEKDIN